MPYWYIQKSISVRVCASARKNIMLNKIETHTQKTNKVILIKKPN